MIEFFMGNFDWIFSGIGTGILFFFLGNRHGYKKAIRQSMKIGDNSHAVQVGGNVGRNIENG